MKRLVSGIAAMLILTMGLTACQGNTPVTEVTTAAPTTLATTAPTTLAPTSDMINVSINYQFEGYENTAIQVERGKNLGSPILTVWNKVSKMPYGFDFAGWFYDQACTQALDAKAVPTEDIAVYASWKAWSADKKVLMDEFFAEMELNKVLILCPTMYEKTSFMDYFNYIYAEGSIGIIKSAKSDLVTPELLATMKAKREALVQVKEKDDVWYDIWTDKLPEAADAAEYDYTNKVDSTAFRPMLAAYLLPDQSKAKGNIIVIAGGGYSMRNNYKEGFPICDFFNSIGYNAYLLQRRVEPSLPVDAGLDLQRSIRYLRYFAAEKGIGGIDHIGAIGFSGGGMTITDAMMNFYGDILPSTVYSEYKPDEVDAVNSDLDVAMIIYGGMPPFETTNPNLPATFIAAGSLDAASDNSLDMYKFLRQLVPTEMHFYASMNHGYGLGEGYEGGDEMRSQINEFLEVEFGYTPRIKK